MRLKINKSNISVSEKVTYLVSGSLEKEDCCVNVIYLWIRGNIVYISGSINSSELSLVLGSFLLQQRLSPFPPRNFSSYWVPLLVLDHCVILKIY